MRLLIVIYLLILPAAIQAKPPEILEKALDSYIENGKEQFLPNLLKGSVLAGEKSIISQVSTLDQISAYYGKPESWEIVGECSFTDRLRTIYYVMYFENGPVYGYLDTFKKKSGEEIATKFQFHTEPNQVYPNKVRTGSKVCDD